MGKCEVSCTYRLQATQQTEPLYSLMPHCNPIKCEVCVMVPRKDEVSGHLRRASILPMVFQVEDLEWKARLAGFRVPTQFPVPHTSPGLRSG